MRLTSLALPLGGLTPKLYLLAPNLASGARGVGEVGDEVREREWREMLALASSGCVEKDRGIIERSGGRQLDIG
jgi:hypothetical protein